MNAISNDKMSKLVSLQNTYKEAMAGYNNKSYSFQSRAIAQVFAQDLQTRIRKLFNS
jgi:hypothetical protein